MSHSIPPENDRKSEVFDVLRGYRKRAVIWNGLMSGFYVFDKQKLLALNFKIFKSHGKLLKIKDGDSELFSQSFSCNQNLDANYENNIGKLLLARNSYWNFVLIKQVWNTHREAFSKKSVLEQLAKFTEEQL